jgi:replicative DNA helicase
MSTLGISLASGIALKPTAVQNNKNRLEEDFTQISQSLQSNNLAGAQQAFSDLSQFTSGVQTSANPIQNDLATLGQALQSGSVSNSQTAFSKLRTDLTTGAQTAATTSTAASTSTNILGTLVKTGLRLLA